MEMVTKQFLSKIFAGCAVLRTLHFLSNLAAGTGLFAHHPTRNLSSANNKNKNKRMHNNQHLLPAELPSGP
jgi:hypothetical protein